MATLPSSASSPSSSATATTTTTTAAGAAETSHPQPSSTSTSHHNAQDRKVATVGVQATFYVQAPHANQPIETHAFSCLMPSSQIAPCTTALPLKDADVPAYEPGSSTYSGRHDGGLLPPLRQGGVWGAMIQAVAGAKADSDEFLTGVIGGERGREEEQEEGMDVVEGEEEEEEEEEVKDGGDMDTLPQSLPKEEKDKAKKDESVSAGRRESKRGGGGTKKPKI
ncbi:Hypothetical protein NocV09_00500200 [Nannochloropsis oceanica]